jgi:NADPH-dependent glutamate synthase beta subunit-like oxidoreductase
MTNPGHHFVAVIGGAISGSVAAEILADHGIRVAVFEQNTRPYGKIEDGLPRWHVEQRKQKYARIDARMKKPNVFHPSTKLGRDFNLPQLFEWGFSAVILANGAWRDRELGVPEADATSAKASFTRILLSTGTTTRTKRTVLDRAMKHRRSRGGGRWAGVN